MARLEMRYEPDPILREKAKRIKTFDANLRKLASDMFETMHSHSGVGLAGPQIGQPIRMLVAEYVPDPRRKSAASRLPSAIPRL